MAMASRKVRSEYIIESLPGTDPVMASVDYATDKAFILARYGPGGTSNPPAFTYTFNDGAKRITLERVNLNWTPPQP